MSQNSNKCVMVLDERLPIGVIANTAAILGMTLGAKLPEIIGPDVSDQSGTVHLGIVAFPVPILKGTPDTIKALHAKLRQPEFQSLTAADFSDLAQGCKTYTEFISKMAGTQELDLQYLGIAICGAKKKVNQLTGSIPLLR